jgi:hypothetical protein
MLGWIREKMDTQKSALGGGGFFASGSTAVEIGASGCNNPCTPSKYSSIATRNGS